MVRLGAVSSQLTISNLFLLRVIEDTGFGLGVALESLIFGDKGFGFGVAIESLIFGDIGFGLGVASCYERNNQINNLCSKTDDNRSK